MVDPNLALQRLLAIDTTTMGNEMFCRHRRRLERLAASCRSIGSSVSSASATAEDVLPNRDAGLPREPLETE